MHNPSFPATIILSWWSIVWSLPPVDVNRNRIEPALVAWCHWWKKYFLLHNVSFIILYKRINVYNQYGIMGMMSQTPLWYWSFIRNGLWFILYGFIIVILKGVTLHSSVEKHIYNTGTTMYLRPAICLLADNESENSMLCNTFEHCKHVTHDTWSSWNMIFYHILEIVCMSKNWTM